MPRDKPLEAPQGGSHCRDNVDRREHGRHGVEQKLGWWGSCGWQEQQGQERRIGI